MNLRRVAARDVLTVTKFSAAAGLFFFFVSTSKALLGVSGFYGAAGQICESRADTLR